MALINNHAQPIVDEWSYPDAEGNVPVRARFVVPVDVLVALGSEMVLERPLGAFVPSGVTADLIVPLLDRIDLVVVEFPKFRDGRGFTVARTLREKHGYKGDIRAIGHVLPDQFAALVQCGFSTIVTPADHPPEQWTQNSGSAAEAGPRRGQFLNRLIDRRPVAGPDSNV